MPVCVCVCVCVCQRKGSHARVCVCVCVCHRRLGEVFWRKGLDEKAMSVLQSSLKARINRLGSYHCRVLKDRVSAHTHTHTRTHAHIQC